MSQILHSFVKESARAGKSRDEMMSALKEAGWSDEQLEPVFAQYSKVDFAVPVPRPTSYVSPRYTALNLFFFLTLLLTIWAATSIIFTLLDYYLPNGTGGKRGYFYSSHRTIGESIRSYLSTIVVCAPLVIFTAKKIATLNATITQNIPVIRLRLIYLCFLIAAFMMLCNFVLFVNYFLSGELSLRFIVKVVVCGATACGVYFYFKPEAGKAEGKA